MWQFQYTLHWEIIRDTKMSKLVKVNLRKALTAPEPRVSVPFWPESVYTERTIFNSQTKCQTRGSQSEVQTRIEQLLPEGSLRELNLDFNIFWICSMGEFVLSRLYKRE